MGFVPIQDSGGNNASALFSTRGRRNGSHALPLPMAFQSGRLFVRSSPRILSPSAGWSVKRSGVLRAMVIDVLVLILEVS